MKPAHDPSKEDIIRRHLWHTISRAFSGRPPAQITNADLIEIARRLGLKRIINSSSFKRLVRIQKATASRNDM